MNDYYHTPRNIAFYIKRVLGSLLLFALACVFIYSAYTKSGILFHGFDFKLYANDNAFDNFQWTFLDLGINSIFTAGVIARLMVGFELTLGIFLLFHIFLRSFTYKAIISVLALFIIYLTIVIAKQGNTGNCGCFGDQVAMTPVAAIIKNVIMIAATLLLWFLYPVKPYKYQQYISLFLALVGFSLPFIINPMYTGTAPLKCNMPINLNPLYEYTTPPTVELRKGKHIISFMSLTCPHCKKAAHLFSIIHREHPDLPIFFVMAGPESFLKAFFVETEAKDVPNLYFKNNVAFDSMINAGSEPGQRSGVPAIYWINNGTIEYKSTYYQLDPKIIESWTKSDKPIVR